MSRHIFARLPCADRSQTDRQHDLLYEKSAEAITQYERGVNSEGQPHCFTRTHARSASTNILIVSASAVTFKGCNNNFDLAQYLKLQGVAVTLTSSMMDGPTVVKHASPAYPALSRSRRTVIGYRYVNLPISSP